MVRDEFKTLGVFALIGIISVFGIGLGVSPAAAQQTTTSDTVNCGTEFEAHGTFHHGQSQVTVYKGDTTEVVSGATVYMDGQKVGTTSDSGVVELPFPNSTEFELIVVNDDTADSLDMMLASWSYAQGCNL